MKYHLSESSTVELKAEIPKNDQIIKTIIGFCNQNGGKLVLGVKDDRTILGISESEIQRTMESLDHAVYQASSPPIIPRIHVQRIGDKTLLVVEVSAGMNPPYYRASEGMERGTYLRLGRSTVRANVDMIQELRLKSRGKSYDTTLVYHASESELNQDEILNFLGNRREKDEVHLSDNVLRAFQFVGDEHGKRYPTVAGMLLFGRDPQHYFSEAFIMCTHFHGTSGRNVIAARDCTGNLFEQFRQAYHFVCSHLDRSWVIRGPRREETLELPEEAIREVIINALIHRNYLIKSSIKIAIFDNRVEVFSPGSFPGPIENHELRLGLSYIRNLAIAKAFREAGYIEKMGSGFITLFDSFGERQLNPPVVTELTNFVKVIMPRGPASGIEDNGILALFTLTGELSTSDVVERLEISRATASRQLSRLVKTGILQRVGKGSRTRYIKKESEGQGNASST